MSAPPLYAVIGVVVGLVLLVVPARLRKPMGDERAARLAELETGSEERFFEEKRSLQAYPPASLALMRLLGAVLLGLGLHRIWSLWTG